MSRLLRKAKSEETLTPIKALYAQRTWKSTRYSFSERFKIDCHIARLIIFLKYRLCGICQIGGFALLFRYTDGYTSSRLRVKTDGFMALPRSNNDDVFAANGWLRSDLLDVQSNKALQRAVCWASDTRWDSIRTPHLFMGLLSTADKRVSQWCRMIDTDADSLLLQFAALFTRPVETPVAIVRLHREFLSENSIAVLREARGRTQKGKRLLIRASDLLVAIFSCTGGIVADCFADVGYAPERLAAMAVATEDLSGSIKTR